MLCEEQRCNLKLKIEKLKFSTSSINNNPILLLKFSINKIPIAVPGSVKLSICLATSHIRYVYDVETTLYRIIKIQNKKLKKRKIWILSPLHRCTVIPTMVQRLRFSINVQHLSPLSLVLRISAVPAVKTSIGAVAKNT